MRRPCALDPLRLSFRPYIGRDCVGRGRLAARWAGYLLRVVTPDETDAETARWRKGGFGATAHANEWTNRHWSSRFLHRVGETAAHAGSGIVAAILVAGWLVLGLWTGFPGWLQPTMYVATGSVRFVLFCAIWHLLQT